MRASSADARRIVTSAMREVNHGRAAGAARARPLAARAHPAQALDEHRVGLEGLRAVEERVEHLVVARGAHVEELLDGLLLGAGVLPPLALERQDLEVARAEAVLGLVALRLRRGVFCAHVPVSLQSCCVSRRALAPVTP